MKLKAAAKFFDRQILTDAYGSATIRGQFDLFDDVKRDAATGRRRILSVAPGTRIPRRRVLTIGGQYWIVGSGSPDYYGNEQIRVKHPIHEAEGLASIQTPAQFLSSAAGLSMYAGLDWYKAAKEIDESSDLNDVMGAVLSSYEALPPLAVMTLNGARYIVREPHPTSAGFQVAYVDEMKEPALEAGTFTSKAYDPVLDQWTGAGVTVNFIRMRWQSHFKYLSQRTLTYQPGDDVAICLEAAATPKANDKIQFADGVWQVLTVWAENGCWNIHVRRVPA